MIELTDLAAGMVAGYSYEVQCRLQSWLGEDNLAEDIPAVEVVEESDATLRVPERLTFRVPVIDDEGTSWVPSSFDSPLGCYGQVIRAQIGVSVANQAVEWIDRGTFLIESAETSGNDIAVECVGLLQLLDEASLVNEYQPRAAATLSTIIRAMIEPGLTVDLDLAPTDRTAPSYITWSDNRLDNVWAVLDAWPAYAHITEEGHFEVLPALADPVAGDEVFTFTDGENGTVMEFNTAITRDGAFNAVVARGQYPDTAGALAGQEILATATDTAVDSPYRTDGPFSPYLVPYGYASPLLTTVGQVQSAANTRLATLRRRGSRTVRVSAVPHPGLQLNDPVMVTSERLGLSEVLGRVDAINPLPYDANGGEMGCVVRLVGN